MARGIWSTDRFASRTRGGEWMWALNGFCNEWVDVFWLRESTRWREIFWLIIQLWKSKDFSNPAKSRFWQSHEKMGRMTCACLGQWLAAKRAPPPELFFFLTT